MEMGEVWALCEAFCQQVYDQIVALATTKSHYSSVPVRVQVQDLQTFWKIFHRFYPITREAKLFQTFHAFNCFVDGTYFLAMQSHCPKKTKDVRLAELLKSSSFERDSSNRFIRRGTITAHMHLVTMVQLFDCMCFVAPCQILYNSGRAVSVKLRPSLGLLPKLA